MIHRHSSPARGWPVTNITCFVEWNHPIQRKTFFVGRYECKRTTIPALRAGWRQIAAATVGVPYFGWYHSTAQVIRPTWRAAGCRPYNTFVPYYRIFNASIAVWRSENAKNDNLSVPQIPASRNRRHGAVGHGGGQLAYLFVAAVSGGEKAWGGGLHLVVCQQISLFVPGGKAG